MGGDFEATSKKIKVGVSRNSRNCATVKDEEKLFYEFQMIETS
jgi:hypothetical protein